MKTYYIPKYTQVKGYKLIQSDCANNMHVKFEYVFLKIGRDIFLAQADAVKCAEAQRQTRISSLRKSLAKLETLTYGGMKWHIHACTLPDVAVSSWVGVSERLPDDKQDVCVVLGSGKVTFGSRSEGMGWSWASTNDGADEDSVVTHWQPMPGGPVKQGEHT